jgi:hypothetical protein
MKQVPKGRDRSGDCLFPLSRIRLWFGFLKIMFVYFKIANFLPKENPDHSVLPPFAFKIPV